MTTLHRSTPAKRRRKGYTAAEAQTLPSRKPLWLHRLEEAEGRPLADLLEEAAAAAPVTGYGLKDLAEEWGLAPSTLKYWSRKLGVSFPRGFHRKREHRGHDAT